MSEAEQTPPTAAEPRYSPLHAVHSRLGATFTDFAGWQMPVRYSSELAEHKAVREAAAMFDLSHMGDIEVSGPDAGTYLDHALSGTPSTMQTMRARYMLILNEDGGIIDDVIVYHTAPDRYSVIANAANRAADFQALTDRAHGFDVTVRDIADENALIAVQGPKARSILERVDGLDIVSDYDRLDEVKNYRSTLASFRSETVFIGRTGYTGEDGFELWIAAPAAEALWGAIAQAGEADGLVPAGLAARDSLRLEAGMGLYGNELDEQTHPAQAGLGRIVKFDKPHDFTGRSALENADDSARRVLIGLVGEGRRAGRSGYAVESEGRQVGIVTSGALSPTLGHPIAMAYVDRDVSEPGTELAIDVRGKKLPVAVTALPFYSRKK